MFTSFTNDSESLTERFSPETHRTFTGEILKKRVLLVEGDAATQAQLTKVLESMDPDVRIEWVATAEEAEERMDEGENYSLILSDLLLPGDLSGIDLWDYCEEHCPEVPFVVISAVQPDKLMDWVGPHRVCPMFLQKPFYEGECRNVLEGIFELAEEEGEAEEGIA